MSCSLPNVCHVTAATLIAVLSCIITMVLHLMFPHAAPHGPGCYGHGPCGALTPSPQPHPPYTHTLLLCEFSINPLQIRSAICWSHTYSNTIECSAKLIMPLQRNMRFLPHVITCRQASLFQKLLQASPQYPIPQPRWSLFEPVIIKATKGCK